MEVNATMASRMQGARSTSIPRIPSLDGLRAISIALVLVLHMSATRHFFRYDQIELFNPGDLGVRTFFVISGFLITTLLLKEFDKTGRISLREFYLRRVFRIFPAFYAYVAVIAALAAAEVIRVESGDLWHAMTYTVNYHNIGGSWFVAHLWSLSVEEQFYLLWPATLVLLGRRRGLLASGAVMVLVPCLRLGVWWFIPSYRHNFLHTFELVCDALATGCVLAGARNWLWNQSWYRGLLGSRLFLLIPLAAIAGDMMFIKPRIYFFAILPIVNISIALTIDWSVRNSTGIIGRVLNSAPFVYVGVLSYSLYLWQQLFCQQQRYPDTWWGMFPSNLILALVTAMASYYLVEQPFLNLRKRFSRQPQVLTTVAASQVAP
jgi:peptidoglycan/LPS O-acetylase OafA/YrhL